MNPVRLHLGCGRVILPGYINVDIQRFRGVDVVGDMRSIPFKDGSVDFIYSCANLEHLGRNEWQAVLVHWFQKLRPGGTLRLSTADFSAVCAEYLQGRNLASLLGLIVGGQKDRFDWHGMVFDYDYLREHLSAIGFRNVRRYDWRHTELAKLQIDDFSQAYLPHMDKDHGRLMMLNMEANK